MTQDEIKAALDLIAVLIEPNATYVGGSIQIHCGSHRDAIMRLYKARQALADIRAHLIPS